MAASKPTSWLSVPSHIDKIRLNKIRLLTDDLKDYNEAAHQLEVFISQYPKSAVIDQAYLLLGKVYIKVKRIEKATDLFESFRYKFPGSRYHGDVRDELERIQFYFSENNESTVENIISLMGQLIEAKPWAYGEGAFHTLYRYSCQHSLFRYLQQFSRIIFAGLRNALLPFIII